MNRQFGRSDKVDALLDYTEAALGMTTDDGPDAKHAKQKLDLRLCSPALTPGGRSMVVASLRLTFISVQACASIWRACFIIHHAHLVYRGACFYNAFYSTQFI